MSHPLRSPAARCARRALRGACGQRALWRSAVGRRLPALWKTAPTGPLKSGALKKSGADEGCVADVGADLGAAAYGEAGAVGDVVAAVAAVRAEGEAAHGVVRGCGVL